MESSPNISVGIVNKENLKISLAGKYKISGTETKLFGRTIASIKDNNIHIENPAGNYTFNDEVTIVPCNISSDYFELKDVTIGIDFHWEQQENQKFQGALKLVINKDKIQVINLIPIENYLASVISSEMNANSSLNLLKAHAIISRSWLMAQIEKQKSLSTKAQHTQLRKIDKEKEEFINWYDREDHTNYVVCADDHCQRYQGITRSHNPNVIKAIQETLGQVLKYDNNICDARYSKSCGGVTESYESCWEPINVPYLSKVYDNDNNYEIDTNFKVEENAINWINSNPDSFCNTNDKKVLSQILNDFDTTTENFYRWELSYSQKEISKLIKEKSGIDFGQIVDLIPIERGESARLSKLKIIGTKQTLTIGKELEIRKWLSKSHLYSSAFYVERQNIINDVPELFIIRGAGWGHGVGLCQIGAAVMGEKGYSHIEILKHYYRDTVVENYY